MDTSEEKMKELALTIGAFAASYVLKQLLEQGYEKVYEEEPPNAIKDEEPNWGKIIGWTIVSGVTAAALKLMIKRYGGKKIRKLG